ncbi:unnamed protein product [Brachionus calyciflorus]|uniref:GYF domain-containing protein n=1 Tax=Brachionus calyciflorus TaxID=104777 RepID=A0A814AXZ8_9BILA|nr:unnamed protein product [Brachionus calyciflorus]
MEGSNNDLIKLSSTKTTDTGGLTFGPAWLRQLSSGDGTKMSGLPPSPGLTFQLAKHRYGREEMLAIYEAIEKVLYSQPPPTIFTPEFEDLLKKDLQRPVLLSQPTLEEQKSLSTCVNSSVALSVYNKIHGISGTTSNSTRGGIDGGGSRGGGRGGRGAGLSGGQSSRGGSFSGVERGGSGGGRGRGRGRGGSDSHGHIPKPAVDEEGNPIPVSSATRGGGRGGYSRGSYTRSSNWEEREPGVKKDFSRAINDDNWRNKASISETDELDEKDFSSSPDEKDELSENPPVSSNSSSDLKNNENRPKKEWRNNKEWSVSGYKKPYQTEGGGRTRNYDKKEPHPEWLNDDEEEKEEKIDEPKMTFDDSGKFIAVKDEPKQQITKQEEIQEKPAIPIVVESKVESNSSHEIQQIKDSDVDNLATQMTEAVIEDEPDQTQNELNELNQQFQQTQAQLLSLSNNILQNTDPKLGSVGMEHPDADRWFYLDPQNQIQGSFSSEQMSGWLTAGYFSMTLMVKRGCDEKFLPLGVLTQNLGRLPFSPQAKNPQSVVPLAQDQLLQQIQMSQQMQFVPQNYNLLQSHLVNQQKAGLNTTNLNSIIQQIQQIQLQQQAAVASLGKLGVAAVATILQELKNKQEALISQVNLTNVNPKQSEVLTGLDPAILDASLANKSMWADVVQSNRTTTPPLSISPINLLMNNNNNNNNQTSQYVQSEPLIKDKIQALFEITKKEEEKRRKLEEEYQMKLKREEEEKRRLEEVKLKQQQEEALKRAEEERIREELRKEQQKKKLEEIIKMQEEEKRRNDELKKKKEEEKRKAEELKKLKEEQKRLELIQKQQQEEAEKKRQLEQQAELARKQAELERQKQKLQQEQLNNLQLPSHAQWAKLQASQQLPAVDLKAVLEQQAREQKLIEQMKQSEALNQSQNSSSSSWSSLFRGQQLSPPNLTQQSTTSPQPISLATIQAEQKTIEQKQAAVQKTKPVQNTPNSKQSSWASWASTANNSSNNNNNTNQKPQVANDNGGFWADLVETKPKVQSAQKQQTNPIKPSSNTTNNTTTKPETESKSIKKNQDKLETVQQKFLRNMTISDEFMKWCTEQLRDFHVDLHIPTFVNFLREIETCAEIEDYVINYLGESKQAKDFAQQFFVNRESQLSQQSNYGSKQQHEDPASQFNLRDGQFSTKQKQKRRSKGQKLDSQLLGFTVQPDPNLKNRGDIDTL